MTKGTHRLVAVGAALAACPGGIQDDAVATGIAFLTAMGPDQAELHMDRQDPDSGWCRHRTVTHWLVVAGALAVVAWMFVPDPWRLPVTVGILAGWAGHSLADAMTLSGAPLAGPVHTRDLHVLPGPFRFRTGAWPEKWVLRPALLGLVVLLAREAWT